VVKAIRKSVVVYPATSPCVLVCPVCARNPGCGCGGRVPLSGGADAERGPVDGGAPKAGAVLLLLPPPLRKRASWS